mgnify:FL=1
MIRDWSSDVGSSYLPGAAGFSVIWSPSSKFIAAVFGYDDDFFRILSLDANVVNKGLLNSIITDKNPSSLSIAPDNDEIAVTTQKLNTLQIFPINDPSPVVLIGGNASTGTIPNSLSWSPDDRFIAVTSSSNTLQIFSFNGVSTPNLVSSIGTGSTPRSVIWSPDNKFIALVSGNGLEIYSFDGVGTLSLVNTTILIDNPEEISWSPDGRFIALFCSTLIQIFAFDGYNNLIQVGNDLLFSGDILSGKWSYDGRFIAIVIRMQFVDIFLNQLGIFSFDGQNTPTQVGGFASVGLRPESVSWSPDCRFLCVVNYGANTLQILSFDGINTPLQVGTNSTTGSNPILASWSPDGASVVVVSNILQIFSFNGSGTPTKVGSDIYTGLNPAAAFWSKDGNFIAVVNSGENTLQVFKPNYLSNRFVQAISNGFVFGNSELGAAYDATVNLLAGANVNVDGLVNYDCVV